MRLNRLGNPCNPRRPLACGASLLALLCLLTAPAAAQTGRATTAPAQGPALVSGMAESPRWQSIVASGRLRVCAWPHYHGITARHPRTGHWSGLDADLAREFARDLGVRLEMVDSSFPRLIDDLHQDRCDIAMFGVALLPQRIERLRFTQPYLQSDILAVTTRGSRAVRDWDDIDRAGVRVAVAAGTFMEPVMRMRLRHAELVVVREPDTREAELESGRVDVFMTDYPYSRRLVESADWARVIGPPRPFHVLQYGYPVKPGDEGWFQRVSAFVSTIKADGRLSAAARRHGLGDIVVAR